MRKQREGVRRDVLVGVSSSCRGSSLEKLRRLELLFPLKLETCH